MRATPTGGGARVGVGGAVDGLPPPPPPQHPPLRGDVEYVPRATALAWLQRSQAEAAEERAKALAALQASQAWGEASLQRSVDHYCALIQVGREGNPWRRGWDGAGVPVVVEVEGSTGSQSWRRMAMRGGSFVSVMMHLSHRCRLHSDLDHVGQGGWPPVADLGTAIVWF
jgi:hypothetical protein